MTEFRVADRVKVVSGKFQGYYGVIIELLNGGVIVSHSPDFKGHAVLFADLEADS